MSASSLSQKAQTKLKTFLKEKEKPAKRFKSLYSFIGALSPSIPSLCLYYYYYIFLFISFCSSITSIILQTKIQSLCPRASFFWSR
jgi:hypothetical protein